MPRLPLGCLSAVSRLSLGLGEELALGAHPLTPLLLFLARAPAPLLELDLSDSLIR